MERAALRRTVLTAALAATVAATGWVASEEHREPQPATVQPSEPRPASRSPAQAAARPAIDLSRLEKRGASTVDDADLFPSVTWERRPPPEPKAASAAAVPAAPPLPFTYFGRMIEGNRTVIFLNRNEDTLVVKTGDTIDGTYRVDEIGGSAVVLTYLPLKQKQVLEIGGLD